MLTDHRRRTAYRKATVNRASAYVPEGAITPHHVDPVKYRREYNEWRRKNDKWFRMNKANNLKKMRAKRKQA